MDDALHHIVIVGGGAAGLELATNLGERLGRRQRAHIALVDRSRTHIWKPLLHSVAAGSLRRSQHELNYIAQAHWHHFRYRNGEMTGLDRVAKTITLAATQDDEGREISPKATIGYDTLVIAVGSVTNDFGTPGSAEYAVPLETTEQASRFNHRLVNACLRAQDQDAPVRPGQLHVAIIGAGARGPDHEFGRNELAVGEPYAVLEHLSHTRARSYFHAQLGQEVMGRFGDAWRQSGQDPVPGLDQDDAKVALRVDPVEPVGDDGASGMVQFRGELGAGGAAGRVYGEAA